MNILLICSAGMSTSLLVTKMQKEANNRNITTNIWAISTNKANSDIPKSDVVLIGPQIKFQFDAIKEICQSYNIPVEVIASADYGSCNGLKVLTQAVRLIKSNKK